MALSSRSPALGVTQQVWSFGSPDFPQTGNLSATAYPYSFPASIVLLDGNIGAGFEERRSGGAANRAGERGSGGAGERGSRGAANRAGESRRGEWPFAPTKVVGANGHSPVQVKS
ncbi:hypothetical protein AM228_22680 [Planktothricoides sp. SR001]|nr:hypothetical protein AM228_22680 [Planktothricoides sp. SR001]